MLHIHFVTLNGLVRQMVFYIDFVTAYLTGKADGVIYRFCNSLPDWSGSR